MKKIMEAVQKAYDEDQRNFGAGFDSSGLPLSYESITGEWLEKVLCKNAKGAEVVSFELGAPDSGTSNRRRIRVDYNTAGRDAALPADIFCKATHGLENRITLAVTGAVRAEVLFYNLVRPGLDLEVPQCHFAEYNPVSFNSMVILEDLTSRVESFCSHHTDINLTRAKSQMALLASLHSKFLEHPDLNARLSTLDTWPDFFHNTIELGFDVACKNGFTAAEDVIPPSLYARADEIWPATLASVAEHRRLPQTLTHNDVHLKNWYVLPNDQMGLSDWQCCTIGHWSRDLAYTLSTSLTVEQRRAWERDLIAYYLSKMAEGGASGIDFDQTWDLYRQQLLGALAWWTVTLTPTPEQPDMQPRDITLEMIRRITTAVDDLDALAVFP